MEVYPYVGPSSRCNTSDFSVKNHLLRGEPHHQRQRIRRIGLIRLKPYLKYLELFSQTYQRPATSFALYQKLIKWNARSDHTESDRWQHLFFVEMTKNPFLVVQHASGYHPGPAPTPKVDGVTLTLAHASWSRDCGFESCQMLDLFLLHSYFPILH